MLIEILIWAILLCAFSIMMIRRRLLLELVGIFLPLGLFVITIVIAVSISKKPLIICLFILYGILVYFIGRKQYSDLQVKEICLQTTKNLRFEASEKTDLKIVFLSDFQVDVSSKKMNFTHLEKIINEVNQLEYDLLLLGGDYVNFKQNIPIFFEYLNKINRPKYGVYAVNGNHDYHDNPLILQMMKDAKIECIDNHLISLSPNLNVQVMGVEDLWKGTPSLANYYPSLSENTYNILLAHHPEIIELAKEHSKIDLMLSGHYHNGQANLFFFPIHKLLTKYGYGFHTKDQTTIYTSAGVGGTFGRYIGLYLRFQSKPEIVYLKITKE